MGLPPEVVTRRRLVFWMVFKTDTWEVSTGRFIVTTLEFTTRTEPNNGSTSFYRFQSQLRRRSISGT
jgi:hypothetical protein